MIIFELYRQLDIRMFQTVSVMDSTYGSCARYIIDGDSLILLGMDHSIRLNLSNKSVTRDNPIRNWDLEDEDVMWFAEDAVESLVVRMVNNCFRQWLMIDPFPSAEKFMEALDKTNRGLEPYNLRIIVEDTGMSIYQGSEKLDFEQALVLIMDTDEAKMDTTGIEQLLMEAAYYRSSDRYDDAAVRLERVIRYADNESQLYSQAVFSLAELYYFLGNYERAVTLFYRVRMEYIGDEHDYYMHLGHAILDERMKKYDRFIRVYYHAEIDPEYADTHRQAVAAAATEMEEVWEEYSQTCYDMGVKKYAEFRASLPEDADDIDMIMSTPTAEEMFSDDGHKPYEDIHLVEPSSSVNKSKKTVSEFLADALKLFLAGDYQKAFEIYCRLKEEVPEDSDFYTWIYFQLAKLYCIFDEPIKSWECLEKCDPIRFGNVYRQDDFFVLYQHVHIVNNDFENDRRFRKLIRGRFDVYYAQYDQEYNTLMRDERLVAAYRQYEAECEVDAKDEFHNELYMHAAEQEMLEDVKSGPFKRFFRKGKS